MHYALLLSVELSLLESGSLAFETWIHFMFQDALLSLVCNEILSTFCNCIDSRKRSFCMSHAFRVPHPLLAPYFSHDNKVDAILK